jgi:hypothetical protein
MLSLGAVNAVNLDGGSSTQMAVRQSGQSEVSLVNGRASLPEDFRPVVNALQVVSESPPILDDVTPPTVSQPQVSLAQQSKVGKQNAALEIAWSALDASGVINTQIEWSAGAGSWQSVNLSSPTATATSIRVPYNRNFRVRVRAADEWGNVSDWSESHRLRLVRYDDDNAIVKRGGGWTRRSEPKAFGGAFRRSKSPGAWTELAFEGVQVALVGQVGPRNGVAQVRLDGQTAGTVSTNAAAVGVRWVLFVSPGSATAESVTIRILNDGTPETPLLDVDAFVVLEPAS